VLGSLAVVSSAAGNPAQGRFVPDEIIVKFRTPVADADGGTGNSSVGAKSSFSRDLRNPRRWYRVREMTPLLKEREHHKTEFRPNRERDQSRLARRQKLLLRRQRATARGTAPDLGRAYRIRLELAADQSLEQALAAYRSRPDVEYAELNPVISICAVPDDPLYAEQWALEKIQAPDAWDTCWGDGEIIVAVIDTGVDYNHRDLQGNMWVNEAELNGAAGVDDDGNGYVDDIHGYNFADSNNDPADDHGHGTHCAGTVAAVGDNGLDIAGVCWTARIMALKVLGATGDGTAADAVPAIYYAVANGADVISGSWGSEEDSSMLREAVAYARREGVMVVAAAGNKGSTKPYYPAAYPEVISVTATESSDRRWYLSNFGDWVDMAAPGRQVLSLRAKGTSSGVIRDEFIGQLSGTSTATPQVSGACALLLSANPLLTCDELQNMLMTTGDPIEPGICASNSRLNVYKALRAAIPAEGMIRFDRSHYPEHADIVLLLADWDLRGTGQQVVQLEAADGDGEVLILTETEVSLGVFRGVMASAPCGGKSGDGVLQARNGAGIYAYYLDGGDGMIQAGQWRQASAVADYEPPAICELRIDRQRLAATIELTTNEPTRVEIHYGRTFGGPYNLVEKDSELGEQHTVTLRGPEPQTQYWFIANISDAAGNETLADNGGQGYSLTGGTFVRHGNPDLEALSVESENHDLR
jgi:hypothetical protein